MTDLIPRAPKRKRQPTAECYREQLALAADEIIRLKTEREWLDRHMVRGVWSVPLARHTTSYYDLDEPAPRPWWRRIFRKAA